MPDQDFAGEGISFRTEIQPGDFGLITSMHGRLYASEEGFDLSFEPYVAQTLLPFWNNPDDRQKIWFAEQGRRVVGTAAVVASSLTTAQFRWFLIEPEARGLGLGRYLLNTCIAFAREQSYQEMVLWTVAGLPASRHLYEKAGFTLKVETPKVLWGAERLEQCFEMNLRT